MRRVTNHIAKTSRILIADDHPLFRSAIKELLDKHSDCEVVGEANDGREALELCRRLRPELVLMDVRMPRMDGLAATCAIKEELPDTAVLILTSFEDPDYLFEAIQGGAAGYILKSSTSQEIIGAIQGVLSGESPLSGELSTLLLRRLIAERQEKGPTVGAAAPGRSLEEQSGGRSLAESLAPREEQVLRLLACGQTNQEIAQVLLISTSSVKKYVHRVMGKLGVSDRVQAAVRAVELGLLSEEQEGE